MFYLSGLVYGSYPKVEVHNLGRFISVTKFRPLTWRVSHPYILADRYVLDKRHVPVTVLFSKPLQCRCGEPITFY